MLFNSLNFTVFLPLVFAVYWLLPVIFRKYFLLLASYYFYFSYSPVYLLLLISTSALDYYLALGISTSDNTRKRKLLMRLSLCSNLGVLFIFKYFVFVYNTSVEAFDLHTKLLHHFIIPAGLSFYTFQSMSYILDVYQNKYKASDTLWDFLLFVSFFPHMVAGPIVRYQSLMPQLKRVTFYKAIDWEGFAKLCIWGYFKKLVIADNIATLVNNVFNHVTNYSGLELVVAGVLFVFQIYCDFSGYSDIATGVARLFNIRLSLNWQRPLFATSIRDFWKRWHISLTTWFRDYLYIGLGGNRRGLKRWILNVCLVFLISGLWHGANFTFILWGAIHGLFFALEILLEKNIPAVKLPTALKRIYFFLIVCLSFMAFRANSVNDLSYIYRHIFSLRMTENGLSNLLSQNDTIFLVVIAFGNLLLLLKEYAEEFAWSDSHKSWSQRLRPVFYLFCLFLIFTIGNFSANTFIYFQF